VTKLAAAARARAEIEEYEREISPTLSHGLTSAMPFITATRALAVFEAQLGQRVEVMISTNGLTRSRVSTAREFSVSLTNLTMMRIGLDKKRGGV